MRAVGLIPSNSWDCQVVTVGTSPVLVTIPFKDANTILIQAKSNNAGSVYFSNVITVDSTGANAGGELVASQSATLPIGKEIIGTSLYLCASIAGQVVYISSFNVGV
jgi:hypothetical protein